MAPKLTPPDQIKAVPTSVGISEARGSAKDSIGRESWAWKMYARLFLRKSSEKSAAAK